MAPSATATAAPSTSPAGYSIDISGFAFNPATITIPAGSTVTWTNSDSATHTITADDGTWDSGAVANGKTYSRTFDTAGTYKYHCAVHPSMTGTVIVS
jgi:plastocyanin